MTGITNSRKSPAHQTKQFFFFNEEKNQVCSPNFFLSLIASKSRIESFQLVSAIRVLFLDDMRFRLHTLHIPSNPPRSWVKVPLVRMLLVVPWLLQLLHSLWRQRNTNPRARDPFEMIGWAANSPSPSVISKSLQSMDRYFNLTIRPHRCVWPR